MLAFVIHFLLLFSLTTSFDADGHSAIGMTTISGLQHKYTQKLKRLMNGKDIVDVSGWGERVSQKHPSTLSFHFQTQRRSDFIFNEDGTLNDKGKRIIPSNCGNDKYCLVKVIKHLYYRLIGTNDKIEMDYPVGIQLTDSDCIKFLINLMGDLHQPLHFGFSEDNLGRNIKGVISINGTSEEISLYDIWEFGITRKLKIERPHFWFGGWTHIFAIRDLYDKELQRWREVGIDIVDEWAFENFELMCNKIYSNPLSKGLITDNLNVDLILEFSWFEIFRNRVLIAGARLSIVLNEILKQRDGKEKPFRTTSSLLSSDEDIIHRIYENKIDNADSRKFATTEVTLFGRKLRMPIWIRNLSINVCLLLFCVIIFLCASVFLFKDGQNIRHYQLHGTEDSKNIQMKETSMME